jgi:hypothetical protein
MVFSSATNSAPLGATTMSLTAKNHRLSAQIQTADTSVVPGAPAERMVTTLIGQAGPSVTFTRPSFPSFQTDLRECHCLALHARGSVSGAGDPIPIAMLGACLPALTKASLLSIWKRANGSVSMGWRAAA